MSNYAVIVCFTYVKNARYALNPRYVKADLRRVLTYSFNHLKNSLERTSIITDILPEKYKIDEVNLSFQHEVISFLADSGLINAGASPNTNLFPLKWLYQFCQEHKLDYKEIYARVKTEITPVIRTSNVIEFAYLFTKFTLISGKHEFTDLLQRKLSEIPLKTKLLFYFTGHAIKRTRTKEANKVCSDVETVYMLIPNKNHGSSFIADSVIRDILRSLKTTVQVFFILDCCYSQQFIDTVYKTTFSNHGNQVLFENVGASMDKIILDEDIDNIFYIGSTLGDQTCGFYSVSPEEGSVFTFFLLKYMNEIVLRKSENSVSQLYQSVEKPILKYRKSKEEPKQNIILCKNNNFAATSLAAALPGWLFATYEHATIDSDSWSPDILEQNHENKSI